MHSVLLEQKKIQLSSLILLIALCLVLSKCVTTPESPVAIYMGDPDTQTLYGEAGQPAIKCTDQTFSDYVCMKQSDFETLIMHNK